MAERRGPWIAASLAGVLCVANAIWVTRHRRLAAVDIDEAILLVASGEMRDAVLMGPGDALAEFMRSNTSAPFGRLLGGLSLAAFGLSPVPVHLLQIVAYGVLVYATWRLADLAGAGSWSWLAGAVVASAPGAVSYARVHHHIVVGAALLTVCVVAGIRSNGLADRRWSLVLGVCIGMAVMTRSMLLASAPLTLAFAPVVAPQAEVSGRRRAGNLALAAAVATVIAGPWFLGPGSASLRYLTARSLGQAEPGEALPAPWQAALIELGDVGRVLAGVPDASVAWVAVALAAVAGAVLSLRLRPRRDGVVVYLLLVATGTFGGLVLSQEDFPGFPLLVVPTLIAGLLGAAASVPGRTAWTLRSALVALVLIGALGWWDGSSSWYHEGQRIAFGSQVEDGGAPWASMYEWPADLVRGEVEADCSASAALLSSGAPQTTEAQFAWGARVVSGRSLLVFNVPQSARQTGEAIAATNVARLIVVVVSADRQSVPTAISAVNHRRLGLRQMPDGQWLSVWFPRTGPVCA